jgi:hypothetical protein
VEFQAETAFCDGNHNSFHLPSRNQPSIILTAKVKKRGASGARGGLRRANFE